MPSEERPTKRTLISNASKVFDPLGLVSPTIIIAKILYQKLWLKKLEWDDELPDDIAVVWNQLKAELPQLSQLKINRFVNRRELQIQGFSDASERAYSAVVYGRFINEDGCIQTEIITSKTKVAPIRQVSLPRLELCGAHLLAKLMAEVLRTLDGDAAIHAWTDSTIVLAWLSDHPVKWKTFVANRVSEIQRLLPRNHWRHVNSEDNPADYASRGVLPSKLLILYQWWHGPSWLRESESTWPVIKSEVFYDDTICEAKNKSTFLPICYTRASNNSESEICDIIFNKTFSFTKAIRTLCFVYRFIQNARVKRGERRTSNITLSEIKTATEQLIKWVQHQEYYNEIQMLAKNQQLSKHHKLSTLTPFLDPNGLLRVGGRLNNSDYPYNFKHPIILPKSHILSRMIISFYHRKYLHPGPSHTSNLIRQTYWIVSGRSTVRNEVRKCIQCFRTRATNAQQLMGNLPSVRITPARPFANCGIDYAGPIILASKRGRGAKMVKGYIAVFVCMVTKAVHIEAVTELTTDAFIAALKRFSARRNFPNDIFTDNGTNFVGSREAAFTYAIASAGAVHSITAACAKGNITLCGCDPLHRHSFSNSQKNHAWKWGGCSADIQFGMKFARKFLDAREIEGDDRSLMNLHNNRVGRKIVKNLLKTECKCHGVSGSCSMRTCWKSLPPFRLIGDTLMKKYSKARSVQAISERNGLSLIVKRRHHRGNGNGGGSVGITKTAVVGTKKNQKNKHQNPKRMELVFIQPSPNYCDKDIETGSLGTHSRYCNRTARGIDGCDLLCCGRGYNTHQINQTWQCNCRFQWCCNVQCDLCKERIEEYTCK